VSQQVIDTPSPEVVAVGEALVDFIPVEEGMSWRYLARPGGAPANVAVGLARLGRRVAFVGRVGRDPLGALVAEALGGAGVNVRWLQHDARRPTTVAIVMPATQSHTRFLIYRTGAADAALEASALPLSVIRGARLLHLGTLSLAAPASRRATLAAVEAAQASGVPVSVDVNLRPTVWPSRRRMVAAALDLLGRAMVAKLTKEELADLGLSVGDVLSLGPRLVVMTEGEKGASAFTREGSVSRPAASVPVVDPTGAGDAFMAAFLDDALGWLGRGGSAGASPSSAELERALDVALRAGAFAVGRVGAMESLPRKEDLAGG
jgi:fructokinase